MQGSHRDRETWKLWKMKMGMEKSWNIKKKKKKKKGKKPWNVVISHGILPTILPMKFTKYTMSLEFSNLFCVMSQMLNLSRQTVLEY